MRLRETACPDRERPASGLLALGLRDAYRELNPSGGDHSWIDPRLGSQRLDHTLVSVGPVRSERALTTTPPEVRTSAIMLLS
ncbi:MAG: hypothetical protein H0V92_10790 [Pseudonocardiales bacterium]|nr:hypothetical protein [Pseudonocardiales bacterium]